MEAWRFSLNIGIFLLISEGTSNGQLFVLKVFHFVGVPRFFCFFIVIVIVYNNNNKKKQTRAGHKMEIVRLKKLI